MTNTDNVTEAFGKALDRWAKAQAARDKALDDYNKAVAQFAEAEIIVNTLTPLLPKDNN